MDEAERRAKLEEIALRMYTAGMGWNYAALERLTAPEPPSFEALRMPEPTPFERGALDRYNTTRRVSHKRR